MILDFNSLYKNYREIVNELKDIDGVEDALEKKITEIENDINNQINEYRDKVATASDRVIDSAQELSVYVKQDINEIQFDADNLKYYFEKNVKVPQASLLYYKSNIKRTYVVYADVERPLENVEIMKKFYEECSKRIHSAVDWNSSIGKRLTRNEKEYNDNIGEILVLFEKMKNFQSGLNNYFESIYKNAQDTYHNNYDKMYADRCAEGDRRVAEFQKIYQSQIDFDIEHIKNILEHGLKSEYITETTNIYNGDMECDLNRYLPLGWIGLYLGWLNAENKLYKTIKSYNVLNKDNLIVCPVIWDMLSPHNLILYNVNNRKNAYRICENILFWKLNQLDSDMCKVNVCCGSGEIYGLNEFAKLCKDFPKIAGEKILIKRQEIEELLDDYVDKMNSIIQNEIVQYGNIISYNEANPKKKIPYRTLCLLDFPDNFTDDMLKKVKLLLLQGYKAGIQVIIIATKNENSSQISSNFDKLYGEIVEQEYSFYETDVEYRWRNRYSELIDLDIALNDVDYESFKNKYAERYDRIKNKILGIEDIMSSDDFQKSSSKDMISIPIGLNENGNVQRIEMGDPVANGTSHYALIIGPTGSGKSSLLHTMIMSAALNYSPDELELYLLDFKQGNEFKIYENNPIPHIKCLALDTLQEYGESILNKLWDILNQRNELFAEASKNGKEIKNISDYRNAGFKMPRILVIMDEFQVLFSLDFNRKVANRASVRMSEFISKARVYGIHFVFATQTMKKIYESTALTKGTISEMHIRVGLQCPNNELESVFGSENYKSCVKKSSSKKGSGIYLENDISSKPVGMQVAYINPDQQKQLIKLISGNEEEESSNEDNTSQLINRYKESISEIEKIIDGAYKDRAEFESQVTITQMAIDNQIERIKQIRDAGININVQNDPDRNNKFLQEKYMEFLEAIKIVKSKVPFKDVDDIYFNRDIATVYVKLFELVECGNIITRHYSDIINIINNGNIPSFISDQEDVTTNNDSNQSDTPEKMIVFKGKEIPKFDLKKVDKYQNGKQVFLIGEPISIDDPIMIEISKKRKSNLLVVGDNQNILDNIAKVWIKTAIHFKKTRNKTIYLFDGAQMIDEGALLDENTAKDPSILLIDNVFQVINYINKLYEIYQQRRKKMSSGNITEQDKEVIHIIISNYQWIEPVVRIMEGKDVSEFEIEDENKGSSTDTEFEDLSKDEDSDFLRRMNSFLDDLKGQNGEASSDLYSNISVKEKFRRLLDNGYLCNMQFVMTVSEINILKKLLKSDLDPLTNRVVLKQSSIYNINFLIDTDIEMKNLDDSMALYTDGIKSAEIFKPYEID